MDITDSRHLEASSAPASHAPSQRLSWLRAGGCGALGLLIGYGLAAIATQASIPTAPQIETTLAGRSMAPATADAQAGAAAAALPSAPGLEAAGSWMAPLPGAMEPCWAASPVASC